MVRQVSPILSELCGKPVELFRVGASLAPSGFGAGEKDTTHPTFALNSDSVFVHKPRRLADPNYLPSLPPPLVDLFYFPYLGSRKPSTSTPAEKKAHRAKVKAQTTLIASLSPEELAAAQRRALLAHYGYVDDESLSGVNEDVSSGGAGSGMRGETLRKREEEKEAKERRALIDAAIRGEAKRKKKSKRARETGESSLHFPSPCHVPRLSALLTMFCSHTGITLQSTSWHLT